MRSFVQTTRGTVRALSCVILLGVASVPGTAVGEPVAHPVPPLSVLGLELHKEVDRKLGDGLFLADPGTTVTMLLHLPDREVLAVDGKAAAVKSFTDDKGTNLLAGRRGGGGVPGAFQNVGVASDGHRAKLTFWSPLAPADGATKLTLKGAVAVTCATGLKKVRQNDVPLAEGAKFKLGGMDLEIAAAAVHTSFGDAARTFQIKRDGSLRPVKSLRFLAGNKEIKSQVIGRSSSGNNDGVRESREFALWENPASVAVEAELYTRTEVVQVPVNMEIGVGLGAGAPPTR